MGTSLLEHRRNEEILEEANVEPIAMVMRRRRLEWFGHLKRRHETENIRAVAEMTMVEKRPRRRRRLIEMEGQLSESTWPHGRSWRHGPLAGRN